MQFPQMFQTFYSGVEDKMGEGREDAREAFNRAMDLQDSDYKSNRGEVMLGSNQTFTTVRDGFGISDPTHKRTREKMGMGLSDNPVRRAGEFVGVLGSDIVEDRTRELWWLLNAAQAIGTVSLEASLKKHAPDLYKKDELYMTEYGELTKDPLEGKPIKSDKAAMITGLAYQDENQQVRPKKHISKTKGGQWQIARHQPGHISMLNVPIGFAINSGIGLMNPFGGQEGYKAVFESEDDPSKTSNILGEVGAKYILGRTGNLLPWDEFKKVRPDVSKDEYMRYKAFKFEKEGDFDLSDGDATLPTGIIKYTNEGIHGPEVQFLGRSLPLATAVMPAAATIAGTTYGARKGGIRGGLLGGFGSAGVSMLAGNLIEGERRRRNSAENERDTIN